MAYRKVVKGDGNQANETASHNRIIMDTGSGFTIFAVYLITLVTAALLFIAIAYGQYLKYGILITFAGLVLTGWIFLVNWTRRSIAKTTTAIAIEQHARSRAELEANIAVASENYVLYRDENGILQFRGTTQITENRHYPAPAQIEAPLDHRETILELWDHNTSARGIEKLLKDKKISYYQIQKTLDLFRPGWTDKHRKVIDAEDYPVDE